MEKFREWIIAHPSYFGYIFMLAGVWILYACVTDAEWMFGNVSSNTRSLKKIDGIINVFGRKPARYVAGVCSVFAILAGALWVYRFTVYGD